VQEDEGASDAGGDGESLDADRNYE
jgi:hypothetical protein